MKNRIPVLLRCGPMQVLTIALLGGGGIFGMLSQRGRVLQDYGTYELATPFNDCMVLVFLTCILFLSSYFVRPLRFRFEERPGSQVFSNFVATTYVGLGLGLMFFNWWRTDAWELAFSAQSGIAYRLTDEKGLVFFYATMVCFFVGAAYLLDHSRRKLVRFAIAAATAIFAVGLIGLTRREMLILMFLWGAVYVGTGDSGRHKTFIRLLVVLGVVTGCVTLYANLLLRGIDLIDDPGSYFTSGEFEPFRYALYLIDEWLRDPIIHSPLPYAIPFVGEGGAVTSVNIYFNEWIAGVSSWQGYSTVTIFPPMVYFGLVVPLLFYGFTVFLVKQSGYWLQHRGGYYSSFLYAFFLLKLFIMIRNGEMIASLVDSIVLLFLVGTFQFLIGFRCVLDSRSDVVDGRRGDMGDSYLPAPEGPKP